MTTDIKRNAAIDVMRCIATVAIFNHLCGPLYGRWSFLATGGALGITLFFFISGYTLFTPLTGGGGVFLDWYKRRLARVWPTAFVVVAVGVLFFSRHAGIIDAFTGGGWFVRAILVAYVVLWVVRRLRVPPVAAFLLSCAVAALWYFLAFDHGEKYALFGAGNMRVLALFPFMFLGAVLRRHEDRLSIGTGLAVSLALACFVLFNGLVFMFVRGRLNVSCQLVLLPVQLVFVFALYFAAKAWDVPACLRGAILFVGGLCLEMYLTYGLVRTTWFNWAFPLNIPVNFVIALAFAYAIRCLARAFRQTFWKENYDWKAVFAP